MLSSCSCCGNTEKTFVMVSFYLSYYGWIDNQAYALTRGVRNSPSMSDLVESV